ncbi:MAG: response regulator [Pirellulales bacterium]
MSDDLGLLLVVDDEELNRDMLSRRLEVEGFRTLIAADAHEGLRLLEEHDFDAVLMDAMMPGISGYEALAEIRKHRSPLELPVLMVTAKNQNEDVVNAFEVGANDYITKPINFPVAIARINCHIAGRRMSSQLAQVKSAIRCRRKAPTTDYGIGI